MTNINDIEKDESLMRESQSLKKMSCESGIEMMDELYVTTDEEGIK